MAPTWSHTYRLFARCIRGLEDALSRELVSFGFPRDSLIKSNSGIYIEDGSLLRLYFLSYFSRLSNGMFLEAGRFRVKDKLSFTEQCSSLSWNHIICPTSTFRVDSFVKDRSCFIHSNRYGSQLVKDGIIQHYRGLQTDLTPTVSLKDPEIKVQLHVDRGEATLLIDGVGYPTSARHYRYKPEISDIDPTIAVALINDMGIASYQSHGSCVHHYERLCRDCILDRSVNNGNTTSSQNINIANECPEDNKTNSASILKYIQHKEADSTKHDRIDQPKYDPPPGMVVELFAGCGTFLIESAMLAARIAPGSLSPRFAFQRFATYSHDAFCRLQVYASNLKVPVDSDHYKALERTFVGLESCWEKVEACLYSAERAGVLDLVRIIQSDYLKDGLYDLNRDRNPGETWRFLVAQLPRLTNQFGTLPDTKYNATDNVPISSGNSSVMGSGGRQIPKPTSLTQGTLAGCSIPNKHIQRRSSQLDPYRYYQLLRNVSRLCRKLFDHDAKSLLVAPYVLQKGEIETAFGTPLRGGRQFVKGGVPSTAYHGGITDI
ncbi:50S rRNA methyltransferase [Babesia ovis]|uniref:50S rRNA methyltransferase n=1 Tax=Babesia ovis TaxID=5869 RepID=A0A9W5T8P3_BABOV|nr:50S rRNA methyltransferase [Babesia ovis]